MMMAPLGGDETNDVDLNDYNDDIGSDHIGVDSTYVIDSDEDEDEKEASFLNKPIISSNRADVMDSFEDDENGTFFIDEDDEGINLTTGLPSALGINSKNYLKKFGRRGVEKNKKRGSSIMEPFELEGGGGGNSTININNNTNINSIVRKDKNFDDLYRSNNNKNDSTTLCAHWTPFVLITMVLEVPLLVYASTFVYNQIGKLWVSTPFALHLTLVLVVCRYRIPNHDKNMQDAAQQITTFTDTDVNGNNSATIDSDRLICQRHPSPIASADRSGDRDGITSSYPFSTKEAFETKTAILHSILVGSIPLIDILILLIVYPKVCNGIVSAFFIDADGTIITEWEQQYQSLTIISSLSRSIAQVRILSEALKIVYMLQCESKNKKKCMHMILPKISFYTKQQLHSILRWIVSICLILTAIFLYFTIFNLIFVHHGGNVWQAPEQPTTEQLRIDPDVCDPLDNTECCFPFPSFNYIVSDETTATKFRVNLKADSLPPLKGGEQINPSFLNDLDGFSTMGPIMFYVDGLKELDREQIRGDLFDENVKDVERNDDSINLINNTTKSNNTIDMDIYIDEKRLRGPEEIALSVTNRSITLLFDVKEKVLIAHTAEIDHLDSDHPLVMVFPASPLEHSGHYALAVIGAPAPKMYFSTSTNDNKDRKERLIPPTPGMESLLKNTDVVQRAKRYRNHLIPALEEAAPWFRYNVDPESLQLLFDFPTISKESQLGPIRKVRDATINHIQSSVQYNSKHWHERIRVIKQIDNDCSEKDVLIARTIHADVQVPWFLQNNDVQNQKPINERIFYTAMSTRDALIDKDALLSGKPSAIGKAKFVVHIPCTVKAAALNATTSQATLKKPVRAIMEFGHGLFGNRLESNAHFLHRMASDNGYIVIAMDWKGMSQYDLPVVIKTLISTPHTFESVRDNLIQGYANKFVLQYFTQIDGAKVFLDMDFMKFNNRTIPMFNNEIPKTIFYGISQGGILGAGYIGIASGITNQISNRRRHFIDRAILGVPGINFNMIMTKSDDFAVYDKLMLWNCYNNRHVRIVLALGQMMWDSVEGSGVYSRPLIPNEALHYPKTLIQAGVGDSTISFHSAEALTRALDGSVLSYNPRGGSDQPNTSSIYGISSFANTEESKMYQPPAILTELVYQEEYNKIKTVESLNKADKVATGVGSYNNHVHKCVHYDDQLQHQIEKFVNDGIIIDTCRDDGCIRLNSQRC